MAWRGTVFTPDVDGSINKVLIYGLERDCIYIRRRWINKALIMAWRGTVFTSDVDGLTRY